MKKFFVIAMMAVAALTANAQQQAAGTFSLMPHLGGGYANLTNTKASIGGETCNNGDFASGLIGGEAKYQITDIFGLSLGLDLQANVAINTHEVNGYKYQPSFTYFNIPLLAQFNIGNHFGAKAGIQANFLVDADAGNDKCDDLFKADGGSFKKIYKGTVISIPVGVSWTFNVPIVMDLRYNIPVTRANEHDLSSFGIDNNQWHNITLTVGYRFDLGK